ncbi:MAG: hypothetical protein IV090_17675 [Candidatus Sericytochromatia bacterium]|nr:hypothetical protein [Candidatus Sericytochromatia bacterium]
MLKKRLMGVVTVKNGWAVQSFGYQRYLPLGKPECLVENLNRWGADEILVQVIDASTKGLGPDFKLLEKISQLGLETPLVYAGGIRNLEDAVKVIQMGADRLVVDALLHANLGEVIQISQRLGAQAVIASLPLSWSGQELLWFNYLKGQLHPFPESLLNLMHSETISEVFLCDYLHEGQERGFETALVDHFPNPKVPLIAFGGLSSAPQLQDLLSRTQISAVAIGHFLTYLEHALQAYKEALFGMPIRPSKYETRFSLLSHVNT